MEEVFHANEVYHNGEIEWQPLSLTLVEYPKGDWVGKWFALISLSPFGIGAGFVTLILFRRDLHTISFFLGTLINECINLLLKNSICEARPMARGHLYTEYGMPSSHAQFIWFFCIYITCFIVIRCQHLINNNSVISTLWKVVIVVSCITLAVLVSVARIYLNYHTTAQVIVGGLVGTCFGGIWFTIVHRLFTPLFPHLVTLKICEILMIRDTTIIPNLLWFEYMATRNEVRMRTRKLTVLKPPQ